MTFQKSIITNLFYTLVLLVVTGCTSNSVSNLQKTELSLETARYGHAVVNDGSKIYVIAGANSSGFLKDIEIIDPETSEIQVLKDRLLPRRFFSAVWDGKHSIYIMGGESVYLNTLRFEEKVEIFDTITHQVTLAKPLPYASRFNTSIFLAGNIYAIGGSTFKLKKLRSRAIVAAYDIANNNWVRKVDMLQAKDTRAVVKNDQIYVVGGYDDVSVFDTFERFDTIQNKWESLPSLPEKISAHSVTISNNKLLVFGDYKKLDLTYSYDFETEQWEKTNIGYKKSRHNAASTLNGITYVIGGTTDGKYALDYIQTFEL